jgi:hypothetical protein
MDLVQLVWDLGKVAEQAALRGEDRAADTVRQAATRLMEYGAEVAALERRRAADALRKRKGKGSTTSEESAESTESAEAPKVSPDPFLTPKTDTPHLSAREVSPELAERMGHLWASVERFLMRRDSKTWPGWIRQMRKEIGPVSQYTPEDLAHICDDDEALSSPIGTPAGMRGFLLKARIERMRADVTPGGNGGPVSFAPRKHSHVNGGGARNDAAIDAAVERLEAKRGQR